MPVPGRLMTMQDVISQLNNNATENIPLDTSEVLNQFFGDYEGLNFNVSGSAPTFTTSTNYPVNVVYDYPVVYWRLAETSGGVAYDSNLNEFSVYPRVSSSSMTSVTQGATSFLAHSNAAQLTASTSSIVFPNGASLQILADFTMEMWINFASFGTSGTTYSLLAKQASSGGVGEYELYAHSNGTSVTLQFRQNNAFGTLSSTTNITNTGTWYHVAVTRSSSGNATTIYVNGVAAGSTTYTAALSTTSNVTVGASGTFSTLTFSITEVALYTKALTSTQVASRHAWGTATDAEATAYGGSATLYGNAPYPSYSSPTGVTYNGTSGNWGTFVWQ